MPTKLTKAKVDSLRPRERRYEVTCDTLRGFTVRVNRDGTKTAAVLYFKHGRQRRVTLGKLSDAYPFAKARADAVAVLLAAKTGRDPATERAAERRIPDLAAVSVIYMESARQRCKPNTITKFERLLKLYILPTLGKVQVSEIQHSDVERLHGRLAPTPVAANASIKLLSAMMNWAEKRGHRPPNTNPCRDIARYPETPRSRVLSAQERARLEQVLQEAEQDGSAEQGVIAAVRLRGMTAARGAEIDGLTWDFVDLERGILRLVDSKTGPRLVPLSDQARDYLAHLHRGRGASPWVCCTSTGQQVKKVRHAWLDLRKRAGLDDVRLHDLRHSAASDALEAGVPVAMISGVLGHGSIRTTETYLHPSISSFREAARVMGDRIEQQTKAGAEKLKTSKDE